MAHVQRRGAALGHDAHGHHVFLTGLDELGDINFKAAVGAHQLIGAGHALAIHPQLGAVGDSVKGKCIPAIPGGHIKAGLVPPLVFPQVALDPRHGIAHSQVAGQASIGHRAKNRRGHALDGNAAAGCISARKLRTADGDLVVAHQAPAVRELDPISPRHRHHRGSNAIRARGDYRAVTGLGMGTGQGKTQRCGRATRQQRPPCG